VFRLAARQREPDHEGLGLGTVDIIYTGTSFAGSIHKPAGDLRAPFMMRDFDHWEGLPRQQAVPRYSKGYEDKTRHKIEALTYYGERMVTPTRNQEAAEDMKGMKLRVPPAPLYLMLANRSAPMPRRSRLRSLLRLAARAPWTARKSAADYHGKKFYEAAHIMLTGHRRIAASRCRGHVWSSFPTRQESVRRGADTGRAKSSDRSALRTKNRR